jgi:hypothetical protein
VRPPDAPRKWGIRTEALESAKEAHRQWPEGRSEKGASKANDAPPNFVMMSRGRKDKSAIVCMRCVDQDFVLFQNPLLNP